MVTLTHTGTQQQVYTTVLFYRVRTSYAGSAEKKIPLQITQRDLK